MCITHGGRKAKRFTWEFHNDYVTIRNENGRQEEYGLTEIFKIINWLWERFVSGWFPLANNVEKLGHNQEIDGLGVAILRQQPGDVSHAQGSSYLGVVLECAGILEWNNRQKGIEWRFACQPRSPDELRELLGGQKAQQQQTQCLMPLDQPSVAFMSGRKSNMALNELSQFDLSFPGRWVDGDDRDWAFEVQRILYLVQGLFAEAVAAYALFQPLTRENIDEYLRCEERLSPYERCLNQLYAKAFVFSLNSIGQLLRQLSNNTKSPSGARTLHDEYVGHFGHLKHIRDSAIHIEDRGLGRNRDLQALKTPFIILGCFMERRFFFTGEDGKQYGIDISQKTLLMAKAIIRKIIESYTWK